MLTAIGGALPALLRLRVPYVLLGYWQALLAAGVLLPLIQPWRTAPAEATSTAARLVTSGFEAVAASPAAAMLPWARLAAWTLAGGVAFRIAWLAAGFGTLSAYRRGATLLQPIPPEVQEVRNRRSGCAP